MSIITLRQRIARNKLATGSLPSRVSNASMMELVTKLTTSKIERNIPILRSRLYTARVRTTG